MSTETAQLRREIIEVSQALDAAGLMPNKSGNVSDRSAGGFLITARISTPPRIRAAWKIARERASRPIATFSRMSAIVEVTVVAVRS